MNGSETHLYVVFLQFTTLEEMKSTLASAGINVVNEAMAEYNILTVSIPTDRPEEVEEARSRLLALPSVVHAKVPEGKRATGAENPEKFKSGVGK